MNNIVTGTLMNQLITIIIIMALITLLLKQKKLPVLDMTGFYFRKSTRVKAWVLLR
jgi:hypothetical protein